MDRVLFKNGLFLVIFIIVFLGQTKGQNEVGTFTDSRDGEEYKIVKIGEQVWMSENMRYNVSGSYLNPNNPSKEYGRLYTWGQAMEACPSGWHLPSDEEWKILEQELGMSDVDAKDTDWRGNQEYVGVKLKSTSGWDGIGNGSGVYGFNAFPAGSNWLGKFYELGSFANFWSSTEKSDDDAWSRLLYSDIEYEGVSRIGSNKSYGYSCRCLKN